MFSFHKPKVYRSSTGCCICKAKSSSSRFTDSKKYELDFIECFQLSTPRKGEICNACVLLVKRFKRLPPGSDRHWGHVVDARVGPGLKSMTKFKKRKDDQKEPASKKAHISMPERFCKIFNKSKKKKDGTTEKIVKKRQKDNSASSDEGSSPDSPGGSSISDDELTSDVGLKLMSSTKTKRKNYHPSKIKKSPEFNIIDSQVWKQRKTCCGVVFECPQISAVLVDMSLYKPCRMHSKKSPVNELEHELENCSEDDLLIKLTDEQIQENYEKASLSGISKIGKLSDLFAECTPQTTTALKKHHMYSKRGLAMNVLNDKKTDAAQLPLAPLALTVSPKSGVAETSDYNLHKIKPENGGKVVKSSLAALKMKPLDLKMKDLVKVCAERAVKCAQEGVVGDNSSDSGYEEAQEAQRENSMQKPKAVAKPVMLSNGMKLHVQPQNLLLAASLAGIPPSSISMPAPMHKPNVNDPPSVVRLQATHSHKQQTNNQNMLVIEHPITPSAVVVDATSSSTSSIISNASAEVISLATNEQLPSSPPPSVSSMIHSPTIN